VRAFGSVVPRLDVADHGTQREVRFGETAVDEGGRLSTTPPLPLDTDEGAAGRPASRGGTRWVDRSVVFVDGGVRLAPAVGDERARVGQHLCRITLGDTAASLRVDRVQWPPQAARERSKRSFDPAGSVPGERAREPKAAFGRAQGDPLLARVDVGDLFGGDDEEVPAQASGSHRERIRSVGARLIAQVLDTADVSLGRVDAEALAAAQ
jgi:hypothetical protein